MALAISSLAAGIDTTNNPATTASINPTSGSVTYLVVGYAVAGGGLTENTDVTTPVGARGTWTQMALSANGLERRALALFRGTGSVTNEAIVITVVTLEGTWTETAWSVIEVTGQDATPDDTPIVNAGSGTGSTSDDVGTVDAGDAVIFAVRHEDDEAVSATGWNALGAITGGTDLRTLHSFYDDSSPDETPNATWASSGAWGQIAWIVNVGSAPPASVGLLPFLLNH